jgi:hypothetical protein
MATWQHLYIHVWHWLCMFKLRTGWELQPPEWRSLVCVKLALQAPLHDCPPVNVIDNIVIILSIFFRRLHSVGPCMPASCQTAAYHCRDSAAHTQNPSLRAKWTPQELHVPCWCLMAVLWVHAFDKPILAFTSLRTWVPRTCARNFGVSLRFLPRRLSKAVRRCQMSE